MLLCSSVPLSFGFGLFPIVPSSVQSINQHGVDREGSPHAGVPKEQGVFHRQTKNEYILKMCNYEYVYAFII